jgi:hypothetical protein
MSKYDKIDLHEALLLNVIDKYIRPKPMKNKIFCPHFILSKKEKHAPI